MAPPGQSQQTYNRAEGASLFDVVYGTSHSRAILNAKCKKLFSLIIYFLANRFTNGGRVSAAVHDNLLQESPSRLNPNKVLRREKEGGAD